MKELYLFTWIIIPIVIIAALATPVPAQDDRENLIKHKLDYVTITSAVFINNSKGFSLPQTAAKIIKNGLCVYTRGLLYIKGAVILMMLQIMNAEN